MKMRIAGIEPESTVDGTGIRFVIFFQGCPHKCPECHNQETWDDNGGMGIDVFDFNVMLEEEIKRNPMLNGITLSGGEPFIQSEAATAIAQKVKQHELTVWTYTGFTYESLIKNEQHRKLLLFTDVLVDGPYMKDLKDESLRFRGSSNQRILKIVGGVKVADISRVFQKL